MDRRFYLLFWCGAIAILAYILLDFWNARNAPMYKRFERQWASDVRLMEESGKLPPAWFDVKEIEIVGGTPETKNWLRRVQIPVQIKNDQGHHKLETLVVLWEEEGKRGVLTQYNLVDLNSGNMVWELGRTLILNKSPAINSVKALLEW